MFVDVADYMISTQKEKFDLKVYPTNLVLNHRCKQYTHVFIKQNGKKAPITRPYGKEIKFHIRSLNRRYKFPDAE